METARLPIGTEYWNNRTNPPSKWRVTDYKVVTFHGALVGEFGFYTLNRISKGRISYGDLEDYREDQAGYNYFFEKGIVLDPTTIIYWWKA